MKFIARVNDITNNFLEFKGFEGEISLESTANPRLMNLRILDSKYLFENTVFIIGKDTILTEGWLSDNIQKVGSISLTLLTIQT